MNEFIAPFSKPFGLFGHLLIVKRLGDGLKAAGVGGGEFDLSLVSFDYA